jgi:phosphoserine aminotransferase
VAGKERLTRAIDLTREVLGVPHDHRIAVVPASDTGAVEMALWSLLGARGIDALAWESFGEGWVADVTGQLRLPDVRVLTAPYGLLPALEDVDFSRDVVFTWNGTTSGVRVPDGDWIAADRAGLTICDATSAAFAQALPFARLDVVTFSWQKALGGEAAHGMLVLGPRAVERLERHAPTWPLPKLFRLTRNGRLDEALFRGETINTPSMLCVEDYLDALDWAQSVGGLPGLIARADANLAAVAAWQARSPWAAFLARDPATRSNTSVCLEVVDPAVRALPREDQAALVASMATLLEREGVAFDVLGYRDAPPNIRIWCGATVETSDVEALLPWLDWAFDEARAMRARSA